MDNPEKLATLDTQDTRGRQKNPPPQKNHNTMQIYVIFNFVLNTLHVV